MNKKILEVENLNIYLTGDNPKDIIQNISFSIHESQILGLIGESGSGKTLIAHSLLGLLPKNFQMDAKRMNFGRQSLLNLSSSVWNKFRGSQIALIFQDTMALNPLMSIGHQMAESLISLKMTRKQIEKQIYQSLDEVMLPTDRNPFKWFPCELSGGMIQRVMIAIAVLQNPKLLIADEPTTALDIMTQKEIMNLLSQLSINRNMSILFISHDLSLVEYFCQDILVIYSGQVMESGVVQSVFMEPKHPYTKLLLNSIPSRIDWNEFDGKDYENLQVDNDLCPYLFRCKQKISRCKLEKPVVQSIDQGRSVSCWNIE